MSEYFYAAAESNRHAEGKQNSDVMDVTVRSEVNEILKCWRGRRTGMSQQCRV